MSPGCNGATTEVNSCLLKRVEGEHFPFVSSAAFPPPEINKAVNPLTGAAEEALRSHRRED